MLVSYNLLSQLVDLSSWTSEKLVERLTFAGFEVEEVRQMTQASKLVVGKIIECQKHPESDHLHLLKVDCGGAIGVLDIVCGAPNAREGIKVIVALPGCDLPSLGKTIKAGVIRNYPSNGMCCSLVELGVPANLLPSKETDGIHELDDSFKIGDTEILEHFGLKDTLLDVNVLPNRPDALSLIGFAREVSALTGEKYLGVDEFDISSLKRENLALTSSDFAKKFSLAKVHLKGFDKIVAQKIAHNLLLSGYGSVDPLVDVGNYAMVLTGQPFHIYDSSKISSYPLEIRDDYEGQFLALNDKTYDLKKGDLVITSSGKPLCLGGIMGGKDVMVDQNTNDVLIEAASFYHANIRHTCARLGLSSPSSLLFAKGVNPLMTDESLSVMLDLLLKVFPESTVESFSTSTKGELSLPAPIDYSLEKTNHRLGSDYSQEEVDRVLTAYSISKDKDGKLISPLWRVDLKQQADIDEEVFRFYSADRISLSLKGMPLTQGRLSYEQESEWNIRNLLISNGLYGVMTFTLVSQEQANQIRVFENTPCYKISNPLTNDHEYVRVDLLPSLLETVQYNLSHKKSDFGFFEISSIDSPIGHRRLLGIVLHGNKQDQEGFGARPYDFYDLSGIIEAIFVNLGIQKNRYSIVKSKNSSFHPGKSADIMVGKCLLGTFGALNPGKFDEEYLVGELDLGVLFGIKTGRTKFLPYGIHPTVFRDLSFILHGEVSYHDIELLAKKAGKSLLKSVTLFDHYEGDLKKSIGITLALEGDHTLKDNEINAVVNDVVNALISKLPMELAA